METKRCPKCDTVKPVGEFRTRPKRGNRPAAYCIPCADRDRHERYLKNKPKLNAQARVWQQANPRAVTRIALAWRRRNPAAWRGVAARHRAKKQQAVLVGGHTEAEWQAKCAAYGQRCGACGRCRKLTRDHIIPVSKPGSSDRIENIQPLCGSCNSRKRDKTIHYPPRDRPQPLHA